MNKYKLLGLGALGALMVVCGETNSKEVIIVDEQGNVIQRENTNATSRDTLLVVGKTNNSGWGGYTNNAKMVDRFGREYFDGTSDMQNSLFFAESGDELVVEIQNGKIKNYFVNLTQQKIKQDFMGRKK